MPTEEHMLGLLWFAWAEFNAIRARSGAPLDHQGMTHITEEWWSEMTEMFAEAIGPEGTAPWPSREAKAIIERRSAIEVEGRS